MNRVWLIRGIAFSLNSRTSYLPADCHRNKNGDEKGAWSRPHRYLSEEQHGHPEGLRQPARPDVIDHLVDGFAGILRFRQQ
jgi:hypothetical protein